LCGAIKTHKKTRNFILKESQEATRKDVEKPFGVSSLICYCVLLEFGTT
jgi:hypothetical protein